VPGAKLDVSSASSDTVLRITNAGAGGAIKEIVSTATASAAGGGKLSFGVPGASQMIIDSTGNVGIGTTSPSTALEVNGQIIRQMTAQDLGTTINVTVNANTWTNVLNSFTYQKKSSTSKLLITVSGSMRFNYNNSGWGRFGVLVNGTVYQMCAQYSTTTDMHTSPYCRVIISGLGAGNWTIQPQVHQGSTTMVCLGCEPPNPLATVEEIN
ncbi:MAG: hypothetical protein ACXVLQ_15790, partial [Bacteriovorax sp.]